MKIDQFIKQLEKEIHQTTQDLEQADALERLKKVAEHYNGDDRVISSLELAQEMKKRPEEIKIMTGWQGLDDILQGFRPNQLVTLSAPTKSGKTSFCIDLTTRVREFNPLWFAFEESAEELIQKFLDRGEEPPYFYTARQNYHNDIEWLERKIIEAIAKYNTQIVFIDHLDFIVPFITGKRHDLIIGDTMRKVKGIANRWGITIFLIAHMAKVKLDEQPDLTAIRGSASIAQESDTVMLLWREQKKEKGNVVITDNVNLSVQANRRTGKTGNVKLVYNNGKFLEQEWKSYHEIQAEALKEMNVW